MIFLDFYESHFLPLDGFFLIFLSGMGMWQWSFNSYFVTLRLWVTSSEWQSQTNEMWVPYNIIVLLYQFCTVCFQFPFMWENKILILLCSVLGSVSQAITTISDNIQAFCASKSSVNLSDTAAMEDKWIASTTSQVYMPFDVLILFWTFAFRCTCIYGKQ